MKHHRLIPAAVLAAALPMPALALNITPTGDEFALANTLFLNISGLANINPTIVSGQSGEFMNQFGVYQNPQGTYGLPAAGIVLSTGDVSNYGTGPNNNGGGGEVAQGEIPEGGQAQNFSAFTLAVDEDEDTGEDGGGEDGGDPETPLFAFPATDAQNAVLSGITGEPLHYDVAQLDIEFFAQDNISRVTFFATFGSEEFPDFVGSGFVDGFGLFVNGQNYAAALETGASAGGTPLAININHPDMVDIRGTELNGVLAPNGNPVLRFDVPVESGKTNLFSIILADTGDDAVDSTVYLSSFFAQGGVGGNEPTGATEVDPLLPSNPPNPITGEFIIALPEVPEGTVVWIDPPVAVGYEYVISDGYFTQIVAPSLGAVGDLDGYIVTVGGTDYALAAGGTLDLTGLGFDVTAFTVSDINPTTTPLLDPTDPAAFPLGVSYLNTAFNTTVSITPIVENSDAVVPLPAAGLLYGGLLLAGGAGFARRRKSRQ